MSLPAACARPLSARGESEKALSREEREVSPPPLSGIIFFLNDPFSDSSETCVFLKAEKR